MQCLKWRHFTHSKPPLAALFTILKEIPVTYKVTDQLLQGKASSTALQQEEEEEEEDVAADGQTKLILT